jgi:hypothetical protein
MLRFLLIASACFAGCASGQSPEQYTTPLPPHTRGPSTHTLRIEGQGTEMHAVFVDATIGEIHDALIRSAARRVISDDAAKDGLEVLVIDESAIVSLVRALRPKGTPRLSWLGLPVRWRMAAGCLSSVIEARSWPIITELGPRSVVEYQVRSDEIAGARGELLVVPGDAVILVAGSVTWPASYDAERPPRSAVSDAMGWGNYPAEPPVGVVLLVPRFDAGK